MHDSRAIGSNGFPELARAIVAAGHDVSKIMDALATSLTRTLCDRCSIDRISSGEAEPAAPRALSPRHAILSLQGTKHLIGSVTVMRDDASSPFDGCDFADIETCITYASLAAEVALHLDAERRLLQAEHERAALFHRNMLGIVGHDLRAPVSAILLGTEMIVAQHQDDPSIAVIATRIVSFANRITGMVDQLLDLSRAQLGGGIPLARCATRLGPVLESVVAELAARYPRNQFRLIGDVDVKGVWDPDRLRQVVASLLTNAVRHGLEDGPINIIISRVGNETSIAIHNELLGEPIPQEELRGLFEAYRQGEGEHHGPGLGLGLYIVREIVEAHRGTIAVESTTSGTTFRIVLPE
ncbi:MAG TPA: HAMP domain-containing sensor histidine kinase [Kofleriaceae bacterium]|nr:HAMP domain-containing sensor histidine kinase [Kofleriaceae bacterium]